MKLNLRSFSILFILFSFSSIYSQTSGIKGAVIEDKTGMPLPGATVKIVELNKSRVTDANGSFIFSNIAPGTYIVKVTALTFQEKEITEVIVVADDIYNLTISLLEKNNQLDEVVIKAPTKAKVESVKSLLTMQKNSANVSDGISAETIKRTPDKNTSDVLKRISGASIQDNRFVIVRGLNDRYNAALLNGAPLPSSEPDRKAFSFDIFPSNMIDNLVITKTASPDLPGDFAGGVIQINTKSVPEKDFQSITVGTGYNTITTFKNQRTYKGGATDWLGFDDGTRALPSYFPNLEYFNSDPPYQDIVALAKKYKTDWAIKDKNFLPNTSFQYSIGEHYEFGDKVLGLLVSISHNRTNNYNETDRYDYDVPAEPATAKFKDENYSVQVLTGALFNLSLKFNENHNISFKNILSINSTDLVVERNGIRDITGNPNLTTVADVRWFTSNKIYSGQFNGDHYFPKPKIKLTWSGFYSNINREIPNLRRNIYSIDTSNPLQIPIAEISTTNSGGKDFGGGMFFSENKETIEGAKIDISKKFAIGEEFINEIKIGAFVQKRDRDFFARQLQYKTLNFGGVFDNNLLNLPNETIFSPENMGQVAPALNGAPASNGFTLFDATKVTDAYKAGSKLYAGYAMLDNRYKKFRLVWGARIENYIQTLDARKTDTENLALNNHQTDFLPSANLIFSINKKQNLRLSYSQTLNRPEFRELAPFGFYDFTTQFFTQGNDELKIAKVKNFDLRYEIYPGKGQLFSVSYFRKNFTDPVESYQLGNKTLSYQNAKSAIASGLEFEFRTLLSTIFTVENSTLLDDLTLYSNIAIIKSLADVSNINTTDPLAEKSRPMQGQSPFVFNAGLQYLNKDNGWSGALNVNRVGSRIAFAKGGGKPAIWENPRTLLDLQVSKSLYKNKIELKLNIQNILAQDQIFYQNNYTEDVPQSSTFTNLTNLLFTGDTLNEDGYDSKTDDVIWRTKFGRVISLSMTYNF